MNALLQLALQQAPVVVDLTRQQPEPAADISIYTILGMFALAGVLLAIMAAGSIVVAGGMFFYKRWRDAANPDAGAHSHTRLRF